MNCQQCEDNLSDYVAGRLAPHEEAHVANHCAACPTCTQSLKREQAFCNLFKEADPVLHSPDLWAQVSLQLTPRKKRFLMPRMWKVSSGFALAGMAALLMFTALPKARVTPPDVVGVKPTPPPTTTETSPSLVQETSRVGVTESEYMYNHTRVAYQVGFALPEEEQR